MKHVLSAIFLVVFGLAVSASANDVQVSEADIKALQQQLDATHLEEETLSDDDFDDDFDPSTRGFNPIKWIKKQLSNKCVCENNQCDCCFNLKLFNAKSCLNAQALVKEQQIRISLTLNNKNLVNKTFNMKRSDSVCGPVPVPSLSFMKFCYNQKSQGGANGAIVSCSNVEFKINNSIGAVLQFKCMELKGGKLTFGGHTELQKEGMFTFQAKNPFKAALALFQKGKGKKN